MKQLKWILLVLILGCLGFIWGNSMLPAEESSQISGGLLEWIREHLPFLAWMPEYFLRKIGHFSEFAGTTMLAGWFVSLRGERGYHRVTEPLLFALLAAAVDETIQLYSPGRSSMIQDVWIDAAGACVGIITFLIGNALWRKIKSKG